MASQPQPGERVASEDGHAAQGQEALRRQAEGAGGHRAAKQGRLHRGEGGRRGHHGHEQGQLEAQARARLGAGERQAAAQGLVRLLRRRRPRELRPREPGGGAEASGRHHERPRHRVARRGRPQGRHGDGRGQGEVARGAHGGRAHLRGVRRAVRAHREAEVDVHQAAKDVPRLPRQGQEGRQA